MIFFRKSPKVRALQWNGSNLTKITALCPQLIRKSETVLQLNYIQHLGLGDYLIVDDTGETSVCPLHLFASRFEGVPEFPTNFLTYRQMRRNYFTELIRLSRGNIAEAARRSGITRARIYDYIKRFNLQELRANVRDYTRKGLPDER
jgi:transcriptional regulator of acetoin/glycerol metabolism